MRTREAIREAKSRGRVAGKNAGSWVVDWNTSVETAHLILEDAQLAGVDEPSWLSGEWAGESIRELLGDLLDETREEVHDEIMEAYETAASETFWGTVCKDALNVIPEPLDKKRFPPDGRYTHPSYKGVALYISRQTRAGVMVVMVGDDHEYEVDPDELTLLGENAYCPGCGQIGCFCYR